MRQKICLNELAIVRYRIYLSEIMQFLIANENNNDYHFQK
ncbi:hypothetical protein GJA_1767 [Janthinobacterium agaricidamnosum NBRC 102515 = DSM 9628]|uniref:Uncharacterized protein n=1 Tax=Janthinobacterium agaricidamnosum NBRC 102515 = DSM 9628 TaxID=1349767 RepID=W0V4X8_9BURK|nr:hypothetical protein GJA_1767 [Janthinobacterium agaricidamnosum NBRC 102515 = DSM 9628]